jgi:hypothetical protein
MKMPIVVAGSIASSLLYPALADDKLPLSEYIGNARNDVGAVFFVAQCKMLDGARAMLLFSTREESGRYYETRGAQTEIYDRVRIDNASYQFQTLRSGRAAGALKTLISSPFFALTSSELEAIASVSAVDSCLEELP